MWPGLGALREEARRLLTRFRVDGDGGVVVVHPGSKLPLKQWMPEKFAALARHILRKYGVKIVLTGGDGDRALCERVRRTLPVGQSVNLAGRTEMREFMGVLALARAVVSNDTGAMHLAAAVGMPCLAIVSGRDHAAKWKPIGEKHLHPHYS